MTRARLTMLGFLLGAVALGAAAPAEARVFVRFGFGFPFFAPFYPAPYYPAPYYGGYYPPVAYAPPPVGYAPPPSSYAPPPPASYAPPPAYGSPVPLAPQASNAPANCRPFRTTQTFDGQPHTMTGRACRQPDGSWRIVQ